MKANEAPEKVWVNKDHAVYFQPPKSGEYIEYVRKDAFIEKAEKFIYSALNDGIMGTANIEAFMRLFKKYMEE